MMVITKFYDGKYLHTQALMTSYKHLPLNVIVHFQIKAKSCMTHIFGMLGTPCWVWDPKVAWYGEQKEMPFIPFHFVPEPHPMHAFLNPYNGAHL